MEPVLFNGQTVLVMKIKEYKRNDIILFHDKSSNNIHVKYLFGLPGDRLGKSGLKFYNLSLQSDNLLQDDNVYEKVFVLNTNENFVLGYNEHNSIDSRHFGTITSDNILGKVVLRYYPFKIF
tara:strand:+ start:63 stop:428 length:366 start_codon:yes stop_codon:yes gene_type:complete